MIMSNMYIPTDLGFGVQIIGKYIKTYENKYIPIKNIQNYQINNDRIRVSTQYINIAISHTIPETETENFMKKLLYTIDTTKDIGYGITIIGDYIRTESGQYINHTNVEEFKVMGEYIYHFLNREGHIIKIRFDTQSDALDALDKIIHAISIN